jgi:hypothetical protein
MNVSWRSPVGAGFSRPSLVVAALAAVGAMASCSGRSVLSPTPRHLPPWYGVVTQTWSPQHAAWTAQLGTGWVRLDFNWFEIEPARGDYEWSTIDSRVADAASYGLGIYATLAYTPAWAGPCGHCMPDDVGDWRQFVEEVIRRYRRYPIVYGIWNEPDLQFLNDEPDGSRYVALFERAHMARIAANPGAVLAGPETSHHAYPAYLEPVMARILPAMQPADVVTVHFYPDAPIDVATYMAGVQRIAGGHQVWLTETGMGTCDEARQSEFYSSVLNPFVQLGRTWWPRVFFYVLSDGEPCSDAMVRPDGSFKPSFITYRDFIAAHP